MIACRECSIKSSHGHDGCGTYLLQAWCARVAISSLMTRPGRDGRCKRKRLVGSGHRRNARVLRGHQVVLLVWTDGRVRVPLGLRLWKKGGASKVELAAQLLR